MSLALFLVESLDVSVLDGPEGHHAADVARLRVGEQVLLGDGRGGTASAAARLSTVELPGSPELVLVVGPEGGVTPEELAAFTAAGAVPVRLGDTVLRTSTAGVAALAVLSARLDRW